MDLADLENLNDRERNAIVERLELERLRMVPEWVWPWQVRFVNEHMFTIERLRKQEERHG